MPTIHCNTTFHRGKNSKESLLQFNLHSKLLQHCHQISPTNSIICFLLVQEYQSSSLPFYSCTLDNSLHPCRTLFDRSSFHKTPLFSTNSSIQLLLKPSCKY